MKRDRKALMQCGIPICFGDKAEHDTLRCLEECPYVFECLQVIARTLGPDEYLGHEPFATDDEDDEDWS